MSTFEVLNYSHLLTLIKLLEYWPVEMAKKLAAPASDQIELEKYTSIKVNLPTELDNLSSKNLKHDRVLFVFR